MNRTVIIYSKEYSTMKFDIITQIITGVRVSHLSEDDIEAIEKKLMKFDSNCKFELSTPNKYETLVSHIYSDSFNGDVDFIGQFSGKDKRAIRKLVKELINK